MNYNKVVVAGKLTRAPELKVLPSGSPLATFSLATNRVYKDGEGKSREETEYHNIVIFGRTAENCARWLRKGSEVLVEGRLQTRSWEKDGQKHYRTEVIATDIQFGSRAREAGEETGEPGTRYRYEKQEKAADDVPAIQYPEEEIRPEDIPF